MSVLLQCLLQCLDNECIQMKCIRKMTSKYPYYCSAAAVPGYIMYPNWNVSKKNCLLLQCYCSAEMWAPLLQCLLQRSAHISALQHALQCLGIAVNQKKKATINLRWRRFEVQRWPSVNNIRAFVVSAGAASPQVLKDWHKEVWMMHICFWNSGGRE